MADAELLETVPVPSARRVRVGHAVASQAIAVRQAFPSASALELHRSTAHGFANAVQTDAQSSLAQQIGTSRTQHWRPRHQDAPSPPLCCSRKRRIQRVTHETPRHATGLRDAAAVGLDTTRTRSSSDESNFHGKPKDDPSWKAQRFTSHSLRATLCPEMATETFQNGSSSFR